MTSRFLAINPTTEGTGTHDPSAVIFENGELAFGAEEERFNRQKHAMNTFPKNAIEACLSHCNVELPDIDKVLISWEPKEKAKKDIRLDFDQQNLRQKVYYMIDDIKDYTTSHQTISSKLAEIDTPVPPIETYNHHRCHAASAYSPSGFDQALTVTVDGRGDKHSTVIWKADNTGLEKIRTYDTPNSLGAFFGSITVYLGYRLHNGEGKIMGLAPYGSHNQDIKNKLLTLIEPGVDYDVQALNYHIGEAIPKLENLFEKPKKPAGGEFSEWEEDLAFFAQKFIEQTVVDIIEKYCKKYDISNVCLAGGVALNCKMNKEVSEINCVDDVFIQPVAHDAGSAVGAGMIETGVTNCNEMSTVYWGPEYSTPYIKKMLKKTKISYVEPEQLERSVAKRLADGELVGWFQGRMEMGPRALGNRSILADPRSVKSRDRVNKFVKHREEWRPFAPSIVAEATEQYFVNADDAPYMINTFDVKEHKKEEIPAVLHAADDTTRPQTVREEQNQRYYNLLKEFETVTGVPVLLNTSYNDSGEPIVNTPREALKDFFAMGLDALVLEDIVVDKSY